MMFPSFLLSFHYPCQTKQATDALVGGVKVYPFHQSLERPNELQPLEDPNVWASFCVEISHYRDQRNGQDCLVVLWMILGAVVVGIGGSKLLCFHLPNADDTSGLFFTTILTIVVLLALLDCLSVRNQGAIEEGLQQICDKHQEAFGTQGWGLSAHTEIARSVSSNDDGGPTYYYLYVIQFLPLSSSKERAVPLPTTTKLGYTPPSLGASNGSAVTAPTTATNFDSTTPPSIMNASSSSRPISRSAASPWSQRES